MHEAIQVRREWADKGSPPCEHPQIEKEYHLGSDTGDKVCTTCGQCFFNGKPV
ncbi:hypothetical protein [Streptomyces sp. WM6372]|uniref:hypothetical protein n=1 Tax=Streptomyces sp. WM6372 TaxID=1415555 RepID=UPI0018FF0C32|nr:hypothetical protein [Streptomyces sp. WM6372]